jgi:tripartite-type tricarboxylate transporter receptor subunit TctC
LRRLAAFLCSLLLSANLLAQAYPLREVRLIVPLPEGGPTDVVARLLAQKLAEAMGQPVRVENRAGAAGAVGADAVAKSPSDGYTLLTGTSSTHAIGPALNPTLPYTLADFTPVALVATFPAVLVAHPSVPSLAALIDLLKANPGKYSFGSTGAGTPGHLAGELFRQMLPAEVHHAAHPGSGALLEAVAAGRVAFAFEQLAPATPALQAARVRALGVGSLERSPALPDVPAIAEALPGFEAAAWLGLFAPARTAPEIIARLQGDVRDIVQLSDVAQRLRDLGAAPAGLAPDAFGAFVVRDAERWRAVAESAKLR